MKELSGIVNIQTGKIYGVKPGSHGHFHEQGHILYNDSEKGIRNRLNQGYVFDIMIASIIGTFIWKYFIFLSGALFVVYKGYDLYEERWAENYAKEQMKLGLKENRSTEKMTWSCIAGFFDGEGNLHINIIKEEKGYNNYQATIRIYSSEKKILEKIKDFVKIGYIYERKKRPHQSKIYQFTIIKKRDCLFFLQNIFPYSIIKRNQIGYLLNNFNFIKRKRNNNSNFDIDKFRSFINRMNVEKSRKYHSNKPNKSKEGGKAEIDL